MADLFAEPLTAGMRAKMEAQNAQDPDTYHRNIIDCNSWHSSECK
jgi:hypothetical protein